MMRLKSKLLSLNANKTTPTKVFSPANCEELRIPFRQDKIAKVVGRLANQIHIPTALPSPPSSDEEGSEEKKLRIEGDGQIVSGVLVQNDFKLSLMAPEDLKEYAGLTTTTIICRQRFTLSAAGVDLIKWALEGTFGAIKVLSEEVNGKLENGDAMKEEADEEIARPVETTFEVMSVVRVKCKDRGEVEVEWEGNITNDGIADAVIAVLFSVETSPAAVKRKCSMPHHVLLLVHTAQNLQSTTLTRTPHPSATSTPTSRPPNVSPASACSSRPSSAKTPSPPSPNPSWSPCPKMKAWTRFLARKHRRRGRRRSWSGYIVWAFRCRDWRSGSISMLRRCGWRGWRWSVRLGVWRIGLGRLRRGLWRLLRRFGSS